MMLLLYFMYYFVMKTNWESGAVLSQLVGLTVETAVLNFAGSDS